MHIVPDPAPPAAAPAHAPRRARLPPPQQALSAIRALNQTPCGGLGLLEVKFADADAGDRNPELSAPPSDNLYCKNLPGTYSTEDLAALFAPFGNVIESKMLHQGDSMQVWGAVGAAHACACESA